MATLRLDEKPGSKAKAKHYSKSSVFLKFGMKGPCGGESGKCKEKKEQLLTAGAFGGIKWKGACFWTTKCEASTLTFSPNQRFMTFAPSGGHCRHSGWIVLVFYFTHNWSSPTHLPWHIAPVQLFSCYSGSVLSCSESCTCRLERGLSPELARHLHVVVICKKESEREEDAFGHITQEEMSLPHCRLVISNFGLLEAQRIYMHVMV